MEGVLDIERDHAELIAAAMQSAGDFAGLWCSRLTRSSFRLDEQLGTRYAVKDVSAATLPLDFERNPKIHRCYEIRAR